MKKVWIVIAIVLMGLGLLLCCFMGGVSQSEPRQYNVRYVVWGSTTGASLTIENEHGNTEQYDVELPWTKEFSATYGSWLYVSAQNNNAAGDIHCDVIVDGGSIGQAKSDGAYSIVTCSGSVGD